MNFFGGEGGSNLPHALRVSPNYKHDFHDFLSPCCPPWPIVTSPLIALLYLLLHHPTSYPAGRQARPP